MTVGGVRGGGLSRQALTSVLQAAQTQPPLRTTVLIGRQRAEAAVSDDGRVVRSISGPRRPVPSKDFRTTVTRVISIPGQPPARESTTTTYNRPPKGE